MDQKKLIANAKQAFQTLPVYGKILAVLTVLLLIGVAFPLVQKKEDLHTLQNCIVSDYKRGLYYGWVFTSDPDCKIKSSYINSSSKPRYGDNVVVIFPGIESTKEHYLYKVERENFSYSWPSKKEVSEALYSYQKKQFRIRTLLIAILCGILTAASYPGTIKRVRARFHKKDTQRPS